MTLTKEEIEMIEREANEYAAQIENDDIWRVVLNTYILAATKYLLQLKAERERAGKLMEALDDLMKGVAGLPPLTAIQGVLEQQYLAGEIAINEYNNKP